MRSFPWQADPWARLTRRAETLPHALLLRGRQGIGKTGFANAFAQWLLCESRLPAGACGSCGSCGWFAQGTHPDFRLIEPEALAETGEGEEAGPRRGAERRPRQQVTVEQVRQLADFVNVSAHRGGRKVVVLHPAESMNVHAANALLKTLEEPPSRILFLLVCHRPGRVLPTILSRCEQVPMPVPDPVAAEGWLREQGVQNPVQPLAEAGFAPVTALALSDPGHQALRTRVMRLLSHPAGLDVIAATDALQGADSATLVGWLQRWCYDLMRVRSGAAPRYNPDFSAALEKLAQSARPDGLLGLTRMLGEAQRVAHHPLNARLFAESLLLYYRRSFSAEEDSGRG